uniref:Essential protein Yae1 N-terminal domain-containing protein n=1 Tax=Oryza brachyantha TaxID=4533 RepID=J3L7V5_ORYBR
MATGNKLFQELMMNQHGSWNFSSLLQIPPLVLQISWRTFFVEDAFTIFLDFPPCQFFMEGQQTHNSICELVLEILDHEENEQKLNLCLIHFIPSQQKRSMSTDDEVTEEEYQMETAKHLARRARRAEYAGGLRRRRAGGWSRRRRRVLGDNADGLQPRLESAQLDPVATAVTYTSLSLLSIPLFVLHLDRFHLSSAGLFFNMADSEELSASLGELRVEASSSKDSEVSRLGNAVEHVAITDDEIWDDGSDSPGHGSTLDREWAHRQNQFHKMGYRDGIAEGQKDIAQEGFNVGFGQSVHAGYKWGLVRGITSVLASLPDSLKEKLLPDVQCRGQLQDLNDSVQKISAEDALQMFHESILRSSHSSEEPHVTLNRATNSSRLQSLSKDLVLLLQECPDMKVSEELARDP